MLEMNGKRVHPISNNNGTIQGTINFSDSLVRTVSRVEMRFVGQIDGSKEKELAEEVEKIIKKFYL